MFNYGIAPGGRFAYQVPVNGYVSSQNHYMSQQPVWTPQQTGGWVQPQYQPQPSFSNYQTQGVSYIQPVNQGWVPIKSQGYFSTPQPTYQYPQYSSTPYYGMPVMGGGCGNCGSSVPMIRRDW